jgi:PAS domain S-box-containing protein
MSGEPADRSSRAAEELLALAEQAGRLGVVEWDVPSGKARLSSRCLELYGLDNLNFDGRYETLLACVYREDQPRATASMEQAFADREPQVEIAFRIIRPSDGELRWIEARRLIFYDAAGAPQRVVGVSVDVTEQKRASAQLRAFTETLEEAVRARTHELEAQHEARRKAEDLLRQSQKMEAVGQLTGGVAHDFNNLLTVIMGGLDVIGRELAKLGDIPSSARIARARDLALQGAQRAAILTNRLLAFSRQQALDPRPLDANRLVADTAELLRRTLGEAIELEIVLAGGLWLAFADENQLETAILNLAVNARDAMPEGGKMTIETANTYLDEAYARAVAEPLEPGQYVLIAVAVADTGSGMDRNALERAFEPFFTTKAAGRGTGLGLSQVYGFVRQSSGHVRIYSEPGHGTTVKIYLPRHQGAGAHARPAERLPDAARASGRETILVVEDDEALRAFAVEALSELGYRVLPAADAQIALDTLDREPDIDLLFTDVVMPGGRNGRQLADEAVKRRPTLKVLFTTGYTRNAIIHHGRLDPGVNLIGKPYTFEELGTRVRTLLDGKTG